MVLGNGREQRTALLPLASLGSGFQWWERAGLCNVVQEQALADEHSRLGTYLALEGP
jgi:hypothetical protein